MRSIALTDYSGLYGAIEFFSACKKADIKAIIGVEFGFTMDLSSKQSHGTIVLIAPTVNEYHQLLKLTSHANME
jgi:DNA polymerase-3 subunit alpha